MKRIQLSNGIIAIGSEEDSVASKFSIRLANYLAKSEKVLFITYFDYSEKIKKELFDIYNRIEQKLIIDDSFERFNVDTFLEIIKKVNDNKYTTVFIDSVEQFLNNYFETYFEKHNQSVLDAFKYLTENYNVRIIFTTRISETHALQPNLADFTWDRKLINYCNQIYAVYDKRDQSIIDAESDKVYRQTMLLSLKNESCVNQEIPVFKSESKI